MMMRIVPLALTSVSALLLLASGCGDDDCTKTLTCEPRASGGAGASDGGGANQGGGVSQGGGSTTLPDGAACSDAGACTSGFCVDGVCCASACEATCNSCNLTGDEGTCAPDVAGTDPDGACTSGSCDGGGTCLGAVHDWSRGTNNGSGGTYINDVVVNSTGHVIACGEVGGTPDLGGGPISGGGIFVVKYDASGGFVWQKVFGPNGESCDRIAVDAQDNIYIGGYLDGTVDFDTHQITGDGFLTGDAFVAKLNSQGTAQWAFNYGDVRKHEVLDLQATPAGEVWVLSYSSAADGVINFGGGNYTGRGQSIAKLNTAGGYVWGRYLGEGSWRGALALTSANEVIVGGRYFGTIDFGGGPLTTSGPTDYDAYLAKLDANGNELWSVDFGDTAAQHVSTVAVGPDDTIYAAGNFEGTMNFGQGGVSADGRDIFLAAFEPNGATKWAMRFGDGTDQDAWGMAVDGDGIITLVGEAEGAFDFGGPMLSMAGEDAFIAKLDSNGQHIFSANYGDATNQEGSSVFVDGRATIIVGRNSGTVNFGGLDLSGSGFIARFTAQ